MSTAEPTTTITTAADLCSICNESAAKYKCPRCSTRTCSLDCVKKHKEQAKCSGKRDRTGFIGKGQLNEASLLSDLQFLEEVQLAEYAAKRSKPPAPKRELPHALQSLVYQAGKKGVQLHILPPGMAKRKLNSTRWDKRRQMLSWHIEWSFKGTEFKVSDTCVSEEKKLTELLEQHLTIAPGTSVRDAALEPYVKAGTGGVKVLLRKERTPSNNPEYFEIDIEQSIQQVLQGKVVVEYPTFVLELKAEEEKLEEGR
jgi:hypothetical protein